MVGEIETKYDSETEIRQPLTPKPRGSVQQQEKTQAAEPNAAKHSPIRFFTTRPARPSPCDSGILPGEITSRLINITYHI